MPASSVLYAAADSCGKLRADLPATIFRRGECGTQSPGLRVSEPQRTRSLRFRSARRGAIRCLSDVSERECSGITAAATESEVAVAHFADPRWTVPDCEREAMFLPPLNGDIAVSGLP